MIRANTRRFNRLDRDTSRMLLDKLYLHLADEDRIGSSRNKLKRLRMTVAERGFMHNSRF
ncbi:hypothetical protein ALC62_12987 [Cyphomyrmex costatus]|uniref:Uncharacterized protein n=1 Tax=Cyphomyrmex costatus TaxID=456900 RepID=A0A195C840_9HYME|nr:hypothetical protein ALC62_12987 [Cyphomyrmex costatus]